MSTNDPSLDDLDALMDQIIIPDDVDFLRESSNMQEDRGHAVLVGNKVRNAKDTTWRGGAPALGPALFFQAPSPCAARATPRPLRPRAPTACPIRARQAPTQHPCARARVISLIYYYSFDTTHSNQ